MGRDFCTRTPYISLTLHYRMGWTRPQHAGRRFTWPLPWPPVCAYCRMSAQDAFEQLLAAFHRPAALPQAGDCPAGGRGAAGAVPHRIRLTPGLALFYNFIATRAASLGYRGTSESGHTVVSQFENACLSHPQQPAPRTLHTPENPPHIAEQPDVCGRGGQPVRYLSDQKPACPRLRPEVSGRRAVWLQRRLLLLPGVITPSEAKRRACDSERLSEEMLTGLPCVLNGRLHPEGLSEERDGWWNALLIGDKFAELPGDSGT